MLQCSAGRSCLKSCCERAPVLVTGIAGWGLGGEGRRRGGRPRRGEDKLRPTPLRGGGRGAGGRRGGGRRRARAAEAREGDVLRRGAGGRGEAEGGRAAAARGAGGGAREAGVRGACHGGRGRKFDRGPFPPSSRFSQPCGYVLREPPCPPLRTGRIRLWSSRGKRRRVCSFGRGFFCGQTALPHCTGWPARISDVALVPPPPPRP